MYDNPMVITFNVGSPHDFGAAADEALAIKGPKGMTGRVVDVCVSASEIFTTGGDVQLGIAGALGKYVDLPLGTLADADCLTASETSGAIKDEMLPADTDIVVSLLQTGGTPTGQAHVNIAIAWAGINPPLS